MSERLYSWREKIGRTIGRLNDRVHPDKPGWKLIEGVVATPRGYVVVSQDHDGTVYRAIVHGREFVRVETIYRPLRGTLGTTATARRFIDALYEQEEGA